MDAVHFLKSFAKTGKHYVLHRPTKAGTQTKKQLNSEKTASKNVKRSTNCVRLLLPHQNANANNCMEGVT